MNYVSNSAATQHMEASKEREQYIFNYRKEVCLSMSIFSTGLESSGNLSIAQMIAWCGNMLYFLTFWLDINYNY
jgi:predicted phosphoadenosine phosphosulfate sulfurtransferase